MSMIIGMTIGLVGVFLFLQRMFHGIVRGVGTIGWASRWIGRLVHFLFGFLAMHGFFGLRETNEMFTGNVEEVWNSLYRYQL